jgi:hypothetical protein
MDEGSVHRVRAINGETAWDDSSGLLLLHSVYDLGQQSSILDIDPAIAVQVVDHTIAVIIYVDVRCVSPQMRAVQGSVPNRSVVNN